MKLRNGIKIVLTSGSEKILLDSDNSLMAKVWRAGVKANLDIIVKTERVKVAAVK